MYIWWSGQPGSGVAVSTLSVSFVPIFYSPICPNILEIFTQFGRIVHKFRYHPQPLEVIIIAQKTTSHMRPTDFSFTKFLARRVVQNLPDAFLISLGLLFLLHRYSSCQVLSHLIRMDQDGLAASKASTSPLEGRDAFYSDSGRPRFCAIFSVFARTSCAHYTIMPSVSSTASLCFCR